MIIDFFFAILMLLAIFNGFSRGLVVAVFSFLAIFIGLAAALKLSAIVANTLGNSAHVSFKWLPFICFILVMIAVAFAVKILAGIIKKSFQMLMLGWVDGIGGILVYVFIYLIVYSVVLFFADKIHIISNSQTEASKVYSFIEPLGPKVIDGFGKVIPVFKDLFMELEHFFEAIGNKIPNAV